MYLLKPLYFQLPVVTKHSLSHSILEKNSLNLATKSSKWHYCMQVHSHLDLSDYEVLTFFDTKYVKVIIIYVHTYVYYLLHALKIRRKALRNSKLIKQYLFKKETYREMAALLVKPRASEVLTAYLKQCNEPPWTSYFVKQADVVNDQFGKSHFNWPLDTGANYHILRTGCFPYLKYHCTKRPHQNLDIENLFFGLLKVLNLGIPTFFYGLSATALISHTEYVILKNKTIPIYFLYEEDKGSFH
ncbi:uncharacterized protein C15orf61 [Condylostylus longicornis]|uniref:uncharacterized protein C15orf61 n=1 Tax=Condylostylus longicornis TaxID=2530218 RepID=UPI00244E2809|nr:uncharacterized protein C15orf61 [Condylostylus longicornis]